MFIVAITGGIATGKSTVCETFQKCGVAVIDADEIAKSVVRRGTAGFNEIVKYFGTNVLDHEGMLDRAALADIVFNDPEKRKKLNSITHPRIQWEIIKQMLMYFFCGHSYIIMELPLLFEIDTMTKFMHTIITVYCPLNVQIERLLIRNGITEEIAMKRIKCQMSLHEKMARSHYTIDNSNTLASTRVQTEAIIGKLAESKFPQYFRIALFLLLGLLVCGIRLIVRLIYDV